MADKIQLPRTSLNLMRKIVLAIFAISIIFGAGYALGFKGYYSEAFSYPKVNINRDLPVDKKDLEFSFFWRIWDTISAKYYDKDKIIPAKMVYEQLKAWLQQSAIRIQSIYPRTKIRLYRKI